MENKYPKNWHDIDWKKARKEVSNLQEKIVIAMQNKKYKEVYKWQWVILNSYSGRAIAIRKVINNSGGKTPGIGGIVWNSPKEYIKAIDDLGNLIRKPQEYKADPLIRVYISKGNRGEKRALGIPTLRDRGMQALYHLAIDPAIEIVSDPNSYGFRKHRSTHDAIITLRSLLDKKVHSHWVLEADIKKCFDKIDHRFLLKHTPICHKHVLEQWLKAGVMEEMNILDTNEGTPQGGIVSPLLCNVALNGMENKMKKVLPKIKKIGPGIPVIRYADDIVILGKSKNILIKCKEVLKEFLLERGLELNEMKTRIVHIKTGFDFLGFNIRRMKYNPRLNNPTEQETVLIIKPSKKGIEKFREKVKSKMDKNKPIKAIIRDVNPIIRGWAEHKRISYLSQETFIGLDHWIYHKMMKWITRFKGSKLKVIKKYVIKTDTRKWNWGISIKEKILNLGEIPITSLRPLKLDRNPYLLQDEDYFNKRKENTIYAKFRATVYRKFKHICPVCNETLHNGEKVELHHIVTQKQGGKYQLKNIQPLHQICHQKVTYSKLYIKVEK